MNTPSKTVYFLGAGFSKAVADLPTMGEFFNMKEIKKKHKNIKEFIKKYFSIKMKQIKRKQKRKGENLLNLEEMITYLYLRLDNFGRFGEDIDASILKAKNEIYQYILTKLSPQNVDDQGIVTEDKDTKKIKRLGKPVYKYNDKISKKKLIDFFRNVNSVITINYDLIIESLLPEVSCNQKGYSFHPFLERLWEKILWPDLEKPFCEEVDKGVFLKLHGSIDWLYCPNKLCPYHSDIYPLALNKEKYDKFFGGSYKNIGNLLYCASCGSKLEVVIVPPVMQKAFEKWPKLALIWTIARKKLSEVDKIVIIGVSFAPSDYYLRWLFKSAIASRKNKPIIEVVDERENVCNAVEKITGVKPEYKGKFEKYLKGC